MAKSILHVYIDNEIKTLAKIRIDNLSQYVEKLLSTELEINKESDAENPERLINKLKSKNALLSAELELIIKERDKLKKELVEHKEKSEEKKDGRVIPIKMFGSDGVVL